MNNFTISTCLEYNTIFNDIEDFEIGTVLSLIPSKNSLEIICHFLAQIHGNERDSALQKQILTLCSERLPRGIKDSVNAFVARVDQGQNNELNFINEYSGLIFIEEVFNHYNDLPNVDSLTPQQELLFFKAYLRCSQFWIDKQPVADDTIRLADGFIKLMFPIQFPQVELIESKDFSLQFIKAVKLFTFMESHEDYNTILAEFLRVKNVESWNEYLHYLLNIYTNIFLQERARPSILTVENNDQRIIDWLDTFCLDPATFTRSDDYTHIRSKPVLNYSENQYLFLNMNLLIDKIFKGIQFDIALTLINNNIRFKGRVMRSIPDFRSDLSTDFSENKLFYSIMEDCFNNRKYKSFSGEEIKAAIDGDGEPDYYIRIKSKVFLFEYKDVLFQANAKYSYDFDRIESELYTKLVENNRGRPKGVYQVANTIERFVNGYFNDIDATNIANAIIYPIIVVTDISFTIRGINHLLNIKFKEKINELGLNEKVSKIHDITVIQLDTLIKFQELFKSRKLTINHVLNNYLEWKKTSNIFNKTGSFDIFMHDLTSKMKYNYEDVLNLALIELFPDEEEAINPN